MSEQDKFEEWATEAQKVNQMSCYEKAWALGAWQACAVEKDKELRAFALNIEVILTPVGNVSIDGHERLGHIL